MVVYFIQRPVFQKLKMPRDKMALIEPVKRLGTPAGKYKVCGSTKLLMGYVVKTATVGYEKKPCVKVRVPVSCCIRLFQVFIWKLGTIWFSGRNITAI